MITQKQKDAYIKAEGDSCPYCNSNNLEWGLKELIDDGMVQDVYCLDCKKSWQDVYTLTLSDVVDDNAGNN